MGLLRLLLAISVIIAHAYTLFGYRFLGAELAVHTFFLISGFYMTLILSTKYIGKNGSYKLFITNRFLRIYPLYWVMLFLTFSFALAKYIFFPTQDNVIKLFLEAFIQSPYFFWHFLDWIFRNITLIVTTDYFKDATWKPGQFILMQAWTLQVELLFYLIAPFIVRRHAVFIVALAVLFSLITFGHIISSLPVTTVLPPSAINSFVFFLYGVLSYHLYTKIKSKSFAKRIALPICVLFILFLFVFGSFATTITLPHIRDSYLFYYLIVCGVLPFLFIVSKLSRFDARLGDLSYPVYLSHFFIYKLIQNSPLHVLNPNLLALLTIAVTIVFSHFLVSIIEKPVDRIRVARLMK